MVVDDNATNRELLRATLAPQGAELIDASNGIEALRLAKEQKPDLVLMDVMMPGLDGYETCRAMKDDLRTQDIPIVFVTARVEPRDVIRGFEVGGVDYLPKPFFPGEAVARIRTHLKLRRLHRELSDRHAALQREIEKRKVAESRGEEVSRRLVALCDQEGLQWKNQFYMGDGAPCREVARSVAILQRARQTSAFITGESGVGKEMVARSIHFGGDAQPGPFVPINCSAIPADLAESVLFGHEKGSFTGADSVRAGVFELADGGALFLDEIGDMPLDLQAKLLRVLEDGQVYRIGSPDARQVNVRVIAASHVDFARRIEEGSFREDLFYRLARFEIRVPPLRERMEDIPVLVERFVGRLSRELGFGSPARIEASAINRFLDYDYPGNIRELKNMVERALLEAGDGPVREEHVRFIGGARRREGPRAGRPASSMSPDFRRAGQRDLSADEQRILDLARTSGRVNNETCRDLLDASQQRASYLLKKLYRLGYLERVGSGRWSEYGLPEQVSADVVA